MTSAAAADDEEEEVHFHPLTEDALVEINRRILEDKSAKKKQSALGDAKSDNAEEDDTKLFPNYFLESGKPIEPALKLRFPVALAGRPLKEVDPFYENKQTFVVVNQHRTLYRFSAAKTIWLLDPLHVVRRAAVWHVVHPLFNLLMNLIIIANCLMLISNENPAREAAKRVFAALYTVEFILYVIAKGFVLHPFAYLRDPWHWFDLILLILDYVHCSYLPMRVYFGVLRAIRLLRALGTTTHFPGVAKLVTNIRLSMMNARDAVILAIYPLFVFSIVGLQTYMGILTNKCIKHFNPNLTDYGFEEFCENQTNWRSNDGYGEPLLCGNSSGSGVCPTNSTCLQGFGGNPNYGYTSFDNFGWSLYSTFRLMTLDFWEDLLHMIIRTAGPWHVLYFIFIILVSRYCINNFILTVVSLSYGELQEVGKLEQQNELEEQEQTNIALRELHVDTNEDNRALDHTVTTPVLDNEDETDWEKTKPPPTPSSKFVTTFCKWECCGCCKNFQAKLQIVAYDAFTELFLAVCVVISIIILALDHHGMDPEMESFVKNGTWAFAAIFAIEVVVKLMASSPYRFFKECRNVYEFVVLLLTIPLLFVEHATGVLVLRKIVTILRAFRLFRVFKVAKASRTLNVFITTLKNCLFPFAVLILLLFIVTFIFAVMGVELYGELYEEKKRMFFDGEIPRWNLVDFMHGFMAVFRAFGGEWIETMWDCMVVAGWYCVPYFIALGFFGNVVVLVLFFAVVYNALLSVRDIEPQPKNEVTIVWGRCKRCFARCCWRGSSAILPHDTNQAEGVGIMGEEKNTTKSMTSVELALEDVVDNSSTKTEGIITVKPSDKDDANGHTEHRSPSASSRAFNSSAVNDLNGDQKGGKGNDKPCEESTSEPALCCPSICYGGSCCAEKDSSFWSGWRSIRSPALKLVENKWFGIFIVLCIIVSSVLLACEGRHSSKNPTLANDLKWAVFAFEVVFLVEMLIKWLGMGLKGYFTCAWLWPDFIIMVISIIIYSSWCCAGGPFLLAFQSLRPLRIVARIQGQRVCVGALMRCLGKILCLLLFCASIWLVFSIVGMVLFGGMFQSCLDANGSRINASHVNSRSECAEDFGYTWINAEIHFDNAGSGFLALFYIATFKGWIEVLHNAMDSRHEAHLQPIYEGNLYMFFYVVAFVIVGGFFTVNLFAAVIIEGYFEALKQMCGQSEMDEADRQKMHANYMKIVETKAQPQSVPAYTWKLRSSAFKIVTDRRFELAMVICYFLNLVVIAFDSIWLEEHEVIVMEVFSILFLFIYIIECLFKIFALGLRYFKDGWNIFDFVVLLLLIARLIFADVMAMYFIGAPFFLWLIKVFQPGKVRRLLRISSHTKGLRTLFEAFFSALPGLFNVTFLLFIVIFVYSLFAVQLFKNFESGWAVDEIRNFGSFGQSFIILFQLSTTAGWDGFLTPLMVEHGSVAIVYFISYIIIVFLIIINLYMAIILQHYSGATEQVQEGLTLDDFDSFDDVWQKYDPSGTQFIKYEQLSNLLAELEPPFLIVKPNKFQIIAMNIDIYLGDVLHRVDIMDALVKDFLSRRGNLSEGFGDKDETRRTEAHGKVIVSSTLWRQREDVSAYIIQKTLRQYRSNKIGESNLSRVVPKSAGSRKSELQQEDSKLIEIAD